MTKTEKTDGCEFVGARMARNLQGSQKENVAAAEESSFVVSATGHRKLNTAHKIKKSGQMNPNS